MNRTTQIQGLSTLGAATALLLWISTLISTPLHPIVPTLLILTGFQSMAAFWGLGWSLPRSNKAFFSVFVGDALLRLVALGLAAYWLVSRNIPFTAPLLTLGFAYLLLSLIQIPFFLRAN